jgi:hypothetical protein
MFSTSRNHGCVNTRKPCVEQPNAKAHGAHEKIDPLITEVAIPNLL